jgi:hypothetical protein
LLIDGFTKTFLDIVAFLVCSQGQIGSIRFDFTKAFHVIPQELVLHKLNKCGLPSVT